MDKIKSVLVIAWGGIGDIVCLSPSLLALRKTYPEARIVVLCENNIPCELLKSWKEIYILSMKEKGYSGLLGKILLMKKLRRFNFNVGIMNSVGPSFRSALILFLSGAKKRIGKSTDGRGFLNSVKFTEYRLHEIDANFKIFKSMDVERDGEKPFVVIPEHSIEFVDRWCSEREIVSKEIVGIHPCAGDIKKRWSKFDELIKLLTKKGQKIVVFGSEEEREYIKSIIPESGYIFTFIGYELSHVAAMIRSCKLLIGNDSGLSHLASALSVPTITIFGPSSWERGKPYGDKSVIVKSDLPCSPCSWLGVGIKCESLECMKRISVDDVYREVVKVI